MTVLRLAYNELGLWLSFDHTAGSTGRTDRTWKPLAAGWMPDLWRNDRWRRMVALHMIGQIEPNSLRMNLDMPSS